MKLEEFNTAIVPLRGRLLVQAQRLTGDDDQAEDLVQEVMLALWQRRDQLDRHTHTEALAVTILRNKWTDQWRRQQYMEQRIDALELRAAAPDHTQLHDDAELIHWIVEHRLPPLQRQIFSMKEIEGYERDEILQIIGCTEDSLRQNLSRARRRIREEFIKLTTQ